MLEQKCTILNTGAVAFYFKLNTMTTNGLRLMAGVNQPNTFEQFRSLDIRCC